MGDVDDTTRWSRRRLLQVGTAGVVALTVGCTDESGSPGDSGEGGDADRADFIVVGAGVAGLTAARDLVAAAWEEFDTARDIEPPISPELLATLDLPLPESGIDVVEALDEAAEALDQSLAQSRVA
jgi:hypothetical protein